MIQRRVLYLDSHRLTAYLCRGGSSTLEGVFEASSEDLTRLTSYLASRPKSLYYLLANTPEEGYQQEVIPYLQGGNRRTLIARKLGQAFFATPLTTAISLGFEKDKRKNEKLLLTALTNPSFFDPWLTAIQNANAALAGIYSPAQLGSTLLARLKLPTERCLLLTVQDSSIRESFVTNGLTQFSRMAPLYDSSHAGIASALAAEAGKLHQYLLGQRLIGRNEHLNVYVLAHPLAATAIHTSCIDSGGLSFVLLDNHVAAQRLGLKATPQDSRADALYAHLLASQPPRQQFAPEPLRHDYRLAQIRAGLIGLTIVALVAGLMLSGKQFYETIAAQQESERLQMRESELQRRYQSLTATFPQVEASTDEMRQITSRYINAQKFQGGPERFYRALSVILDKHQAINLDSIDWKQGTTADQPNQVDLAGQVKPGSASTPRQTIAAFDAFVKDLETLPELTVEIAQSPYDIDPKRALKGSDRDQEILKQHPFLLKIRYREAS